MIHYTPHQYIIHIYTIYSALCIIYNISIYHLSYPVFYTIYLHFIYHVSCYPYSYIQYLILLTNIISYSIYYYLQILHITSYSFQYYVYYTNIIIYNYNKNNIVIIQFLFFLCNMHNNIDTLLTIYFTILKCFCIYCIVYCLFHNFLYAYCTTIIKHMFDPVLRFRHIFYV